MEDVVLPPPTLDELKVRRDSIRRELVDINRAIARREGYTVLLRDDPTYTPLHEDLTLEIIAEGVVEIGPPHLYSFSYDNYHSEHMAYIDVPIESNTTPTRTIDLSDLSDSDSSGDESVPTIPTTSQLKRQSIAITPERLKYQTSIPDGLKLGLHFHCIEPTSEEEYPLPPLNSLYVSKKTIYRGKTGGKAAKGTLKDSLVQLPNLNDYTILMVDPGTSSMAIRLSRRAGGNASEVYTWETKDFRTDSYMLNNMRQYLLSVIESHMPDLIAVELQLSKFGIEYSQHLILNLGTELGITTVLIQPGTRFGAFGISTRDKDRDRRIEDVGITLLDDDDREYLMSIKGITSANGTKVSAGKRMNDLLAVVTLEVALESILVQAVMEKK